MERCERLNLIRDAVERLDNSDLICVWNHYCEENYYDEVIMPMYELESYIEGMERMKIVEEFSEAEHFRTYHSWFFLDIHGWHSFDFTYEDVCPIDIDDLVRWIEDYEDDCDNDELKDVFEYITEYDDMNEEDEDEE